MKISNTMSYALRSLLIIGKKGKTSAKKLAETEGMPNRFLLQILKKFVVAKILTSERGAKGGYTLLHPLNKISLLKAYEAIEGPLDVEIPTTMPSIISANLRKTLENGILELRQQMENTKLSDLLVD